MLTVRLSDEIKAWLKQRAIAELGKKSAGAYIQHLVRQAQDQCMHYEYKTGTTNTSKVRLELRLQRGEMAALQKIVENVESSPNYYLVSLLRAHLLRDVQLQGKELEVLRQANYQLAAIGRNLNQIAKRLNEQDTKTFSEEMIEKTVNESISFLKPHIAMMTEILDKNLSRWDIIK